MSSETPFMLWSAFRKFKLLLKSSSAIGDERIIEKMERYTAFARGHREAIRQRRRRLVRRGLKQTQVARLRNIVKSLIEEVLIPVVADVLKAALQTMRVCPAERMPEDQRATSLQAGPLALALSTAVLEEDPSVPYLAYQKMRGIFGIFAKKERLRRHALGPAHPDYVAQPLLWAFTGPTVQGRRARYIYTLEQRELLRSVLLTSRASRRRRPDSPASETLLQRIQRVAASLTEQERQVPWPIHAAELEPA